MAPAATATAPSAAIAQPLDLRERRLEPRDRAVGLDAQEAVPRRRRGRPRGSRRRRGTRTSFARRPRPGRRARRPSARGSAPDRPARPGRRTRRGSTSRSRRRRRGGRPTGSTTAGRPRSPGRRRPSAAPRASRPPGRPRPAAGRRVPGHVRVVPLEPRERRAVRRRPRRGDEVDPADEDAPGAVGPVEGEGDDLVLDEQRVLVADRVVRLAHGVQPVGAGIEPHVGEPVRPLGRERDGRRDALRVEPVQPPVAPPTRRRRLPPAARYEPPPYSWTWFRTLNGTGVSSWVAPSGPRRSSVRRPPSADRPSSQ